MTQEEITTIVQLVVQALLTNSKTIAQLTAVQDVSDSDCFELSGGKKVSYGTLAGLIISEIGSIQNFTVVDYDGRDEVSTFTYTRNTGVITIKQAGRAAKTITIATATTSRPGLMSAEDKTNLASAVNKVLSSLSKSSAQSNVVVTVNFADGTSTSVTIPAATTSSAGVMSATDKANLNTAKNTATDLNNKLGAANGIATLDSNGKLNSDQLPSNVVTDMAALQKADLDESSRLKAGQAPRNMIYNVTSDANLNGLEHGDVYFYEGQLFEFEYVNQHGSRVSNQLGAPEENIIYCHKSTGMLYKWDSTNGEFVRFGLSLNAIGRMSHTQASPQVMKSMGLSLDNPGNPLTQVVYSPEVGDIYFDPSSRKILYQASGSTVDLGEPSELLIYCNAMTNKLYRWNGTAMVHVD